MLELADTAAKDKHFEEDNFFMTRFHFYLWRQHRTYLKPLQSSVDICEYIGLARGALCYHNLFSRVQNYCISRELGPNLGDQMSSSVAVWLAASQLPGMHLISPGKLYGYT